MKILFSYLNAPFQPAALFVVILISGLPLHISAQITPCPMTPSGPCSMVGEPQLDPSDDSGIQKYLARTIQYNNRLVDYNTRDIGEHNPCSFWNNTTGAWDMCSDCLPRTDNPGPFSCYPTASINDCECTYCLDRYCRELNMLTQLNATFIARAAGLWGGENLLFTDGSNTPLHKIAAEQLVRDINFRYDCAGLRRPIIQAAILEHISESVDGVEITQAVINAFLSEMTPAEQTYYSATGRKFNRFNIYFLTTTDPVHTSEVPDITRLEGKMWFYYLAKLYIDAGFTSLHMGDAQRWAFNDMPDFNHTHQILTKIRAYAASILNDEGHPQLLVMNAELPDMYHVEGSGELLFDFNNVVARPREYPPHPEDRRVPCDEPEQPANLFAGTPCDGLNINAVIDPCHSKSIGLSEGGTTALGGDYDITPYFISFDFGTGIHETGPDGLPGTGPGTYYEGIEACWYYDDQAWFYQLPDACKEYWMTEFICKVREYDNGQGFLAMPGDVSFNEWNPALNGGCSSPRHFNLSDHPGMVTAMANVWMPNQNLSIIFDHDCGYPMRLCKIVDHEYVFRSFGYYASLSVENPDCSSTYTWRIKKPNGSWFPTFYGKYCYLENLPNGTYQVELRQDNLGLPTSMNGSQTVKMSFTVDKKEDCCQPTATPLCRYPDNEYEFHYERDEEDKSPTHNVYNFLVEIKGSIMDSIDYTNVSPTVNSNVFTTSGNETSFEEVEKMQRYVIGRYRTLKGNAVDTFKTTLQIKRVQQAQTQVLTLHIPMSDCNGKDSSKTEERIMPIQGTQKEKLRIFPNPVSSGATQVNIVHSAIAFNRKYKVNIFSSIGMKISEQIETGNTESAIILQNIPALKLSGLFLISIEDENGTFVSRGMFVVTEK